MAGRATLVRAEPGFTLPFFDRLAPPPPPGLVAARIEAHTKPGDVVLDLAGRGGWVGRAAVDRQRRAVSLESTPLTRLLAELVLRPPDLRHLDAAFQAMGASPRGQTSLKVAVGELFATRCATCGRALVLDEIVWPDQQAPAVLGGGTARKVYACPVCRGQRGSDQRTAELDDADLDRAVAAPDDLAGVRARLRDRFPVLDGGVELVDGLLDLHTPRQLGGLDAILDRIETDLRAAPVDAALRLAFLHALTPASRLNGHPHRVGSLRIQAGHVRAPNPGPWRERNPWLAFEDGIRIVRGFIQRLESGPGGAVQARLGNDLQSLDEGSATAVLSIAGPSTTRAIGAEASVNRGGWDGSAAGLRRRIRLVVGQPPVRPAASGAHAGERRPGDDPGRSRRSRRRAGRRPLRLRRADRPPPVLGGGCQPDRCRRRGRVAEGPRRAGQRGPAAGGDPHRARPCRPAPTARRRSRAGRGPARGRAGTRRPRRPGRCPGPGTRWRPHIGRDQALRPERRRAIGSG